MTPSTPRLPQDPSWEISEQVCLRTASILFLIPAGKETWLWLEPLVHIAAIIDMLIWSRNVLDEQHREQKDLTVDVSVVPEICEWQRVVSSLYICDRLEIDGTKWLKNSSASGVTND